MTRTTFRPRSVPSPHPLNLVWCWYAAAVNQVITPTAAAGLSAVRFLTDEVVQRVLADIESTGMSAGDRLPSERVLTERYGVSRVTLRSALRRLEVGGVIAAAPSRGWFITPEPSIGDAMTQPAVDGAPAQDRILGFTEHARERGLTVRSRVLRHEVRPATVLEAERLRMAPGGALVDLWRVRYLDNVAIVVEHNRLPLAICPALADADFRTQSLYDTLREATPPQVPVSADYSVEARAATAEETELLELTGPIPVLVASILATNAGGRPIEFTDSSYRGDRYRYRAKIGALHLRSS